MKKIHLFMMSAVVVAVAAQAADLSDSTFRVRKRVCDILDSSCSSWVSRRTAEEATGTLVTVATMGDPSAMDVDGAGATAGTWVSGADVSFVIQNTGDAATGVLSHVFGGSNPSRFELSPTGVNTCNGSLAPAATCTLSVRPKADDNGSYTATLDVSASPGGHLQYDLAGTASGFAASSSISVTPSSATMDIDTLSPGAYVTFTVTNCASCETTSALTAWIDNVTNFEIGDNTCTTLAAGESCTIKVRPQSMENGSYAGTLAISATTGGTDTSALSGTASGIDNGLMCWGADGYGQLGNASNMSSLVPVWVTGMGGSVVFGTSGTSHSCAIQSGIVYCWGANNVGQLGNGGTTNSNVPVAVSGLDTNMTSVAAGSESSCAIQSGALYCWGRNNYGQLGDGSTNDSTVPVAVSGMDSNMTSVSLGRGGHGCAIKSGALYCWGRNNYGQLGNGGTSDSSLPIAVTGMGDGVTSVAVGSAFTCAVKSGSLYCWGVNDHAQIGNNNYSTVYPQPVLMTGMESNITDVVTGRAAACALKSGALYCWGENGDGQAGIGTVSYSTSIGLVTGMEANITSVSFNNLSVCAIKAGGLYCWGDNYYGQLGDGSTNDHSLPVGVSGMDSRVMGVMGGSTHTCAMKN